MFFRFKKFEITSQGAGPTDIEYKVPISSISFVLGNDRTDFSVVFIKSGLPRKQLRLHPRQNAISAVGSPHDLRAANVELFKFPAKLFHFTRLTYCEYGEEEYKQAPVLVPAANIKKVSGNKNKGRSFIHFDPELQDDPSVQMQKYFSEAGFQALGTRAYLHRLNPNYAWPQATLT